MSESIVIVGAGLAGLSAAHKLEELGYSPTIYEATDCCGGRMKTDFHEGFILDHGFHLVLSTYKELFNLCSPKELEISYFPPGAMFRHNNEWTSILNPLRKAFSLEDRIPFLFDFMKLGKFYLKHNPHLDQVPISTLFQEIGLSAEFINKVFRPFFAGVFLDPDLKTSSHAFQRLFSFFVKGKGGLPRKGIQAVPEAIKRKLNRTQIHFNTKVERFEGGKLYLGTGEILNPDRVLLALPTAAASPFIPSLSKVEDQNVTCSYFTIEEGAFIPSPFIYLEDDPKNPINNFSLLSLIQPSYAPSGQLLVSVTVLNQHWQNDPGIERVIAEQLGTDFKISPSRFQHLKTFHIAHALPDQSTPPPLEGKYCYDQEEHLYLCGELVDYPSFNDAVISGTKAAEVIHQDISLHNLI